MKRVASAALLALVLLAAGGAQLASSTTATAGRTEVAVRLAAPPLALAPGTGRHIDTQQRAFRAALADELPAARIRWRYRLVQNGFAVALPGRDVARLRRLPGVSEVVASRVYAPALDQSPGQIGAPAVWGTGLSTAGQGMKIGIIDSGVDERHPFFDPTGYVMPKGFPKGQRQFTSAKVVVARAFAPPGAPAGSRLAFARGDVSHGTHVAGIAAGDPSTRASGSRLVSGVAPKAYIGNYKVFVPTVSGASPNAGAAELVAAIEAAVADGMDVINFSGGEHEVEPSRDIVARALDAAAAAGVVPVVAAGNSYDEEGAGSVSSPGSSASTITVGAAEFVRNGSVPIHADFSSVGPTPISLRLKPDVVAPGVDVLSSIPNGGWSSISGTSMASPHAAGAAALLRERHRGWTVAQIKAALVETGNPIRLAVGSATPAPPVFAGGGLISLPQADRPLVFAQPSSLSFGLQRPGASVSRAIQLTDAGGGAGSWQVSVDAESVPGAAVIVPDTIEVPGELEITLNVSATAQEGDVTGFVTLRRGSDVRHVPFWGRIAAPRLVRHTPRVLRSAGLRGGSTRGQGSFVSRYRYPDDPRGIGVHTLLQGPELVYRLRITKRVANFGVVITQEGHGVAVEPRVVEELDENRLTGATALPVVVNPYLPQYGARVQVAGALVPRPGNYGIVFDSPTPAEAGRFRFRPWVDDTTPPQVTLEAAAVRGGRPLRLVVTDRGSGVYPRSLAVFVDGHASTHVFRSGVLRVPTSQLRTGPHRLLVFVADYQETRNMETIAGILPNTRFFRAKFTLR
jgi:subtilisin family serine protease